MSPRLSWKPQSDELCKRMWLSVVKLCVSEGVLGVLPSLVSHLGSAPCLSRPVALAGSLSFFSQEVFKCPLV